MLINRKLHIGLPNSDQISVPRANQTLLSLKTRISQLQYDHFSIHTKTPLIQGNDLSYANVRGANTCRSATADEQYRLGCILFLRTFSTRVIFYQL